MNIIFVFSNASAARSATKVRECECICIDSRRIDSPASCKYLPFKYVEHVFTLFSSFKTTGYDLNVETDVLIPLICWCVCSIAWKAATPVLSNGLSGK